MKTINKIIYTLLFIGVTSCNVDKITSLKDDFRITVTPDAVGNKKEIQINNATNSDPVPSEIIKISISGDVASDIYTSDGSSSFVFDEGKIVIGLKKGMEASPESPIHVSIKVEAEGYLSKTKTVTFDGSGSESININLVKIDDLPETIQIVEETIKLANYKTEKDIEVSVKSSDETEELANMVLKAGSSFEDDNGEAVQGSNLIMNIVTYELQTGIVDEQTGYSATEEIEEITIPASGDDEEATLEPFSVISVDTTLDGTPVNISENTPAKVSVSIPDDGQEYQVFFVEKGSDTATPILSSEGNLVNKSFNSSSIKQLQFKAYKTGLYFVAIKLFQSIFCSENLTTLTFSNNKAADRFRIILKEVDRSKDKEDWNIISSSNVTLFNGEEIAIQFRPKKESIYNLTVIHNKKNILNKEIVCGLKNNSTFDLSTTETASYIIPMGITCPSISIALDETPIYYKIKDESTFYPYGKAVAGELKNTPKLEDNTEYEFQLFYDETITTEAILGSEIKELIDSYDLDEICDEIEEEI
jgi:hypothetical protein